ncbi:MAG: NAD(P)H-dependent oxidoreductase [Cytophagales bacterium]|nr:NAD(P)H-dependent oxidoreductase [Cytophagales bacterium]
MKKILILFAHPRLEQSRVNKLLINAAAQVSDVTIHDLYENYPDFNIDTRYEKKLLLAHDVVIWHHPFYWYSCPPLLKQWIDVVLEYNWAYGPEGNALVGKTTLNVLTAGGTRKVYCAEGKNHYTVREFLRPFEQTARLCGMEYLPPFAVLGTHLLDPASLKGYEEQYISLLNLLKAGDIQVATDESCQFLNDLHLINNA